jgi:hypothetical protein
MLANFLEGFYQGVKDFRRIYVGYFAPVIAVSRLVKKRSWNYPRQLRVVYRYAFWEGKIR